jgi:hypothetical protein
MADNGRWFKLWCSCAFDQDLDNLAIDDFGRWCKLGAYIKEHGRSGKIKLKSPSKTICSALQVSTYDDLINKLKILPNITVQNTCENETLACVSHFIEFDNWRKYQENLSTDRVHKFRQNETHKKRGEEKRIRREKEENKLLMQSAEEISPSAGWKDEDLWLFEFLKNRDLFGKHGYCVDGILDYTYWDNVSQIVHGLSKEFLEPEFARMSTWFDDNPSRKPTQRGLRKFIKSWIERAHEKERRFKK